MNLFLKSYCIGLIFLTLLAWQSCFNCGLAQEWHLYPRPWIQEIQLPAQYEEIPNQSVYLDRLGHLFLGKNNGLTIVTGNRYLHLHMRGPVFVTSGNDDSLFYAAEDDIGHLVMDEDLGFHAESIIDLVPPAFRTFVPSELFFRGGELIMETDRGIYSLSGRQIQYNAPGSTPAGLIPGNDGPDTPANELVGNLPGLNDAECMEWTVSGLLMAALPGTGIAIMDRDGRMINMLGTGSDLPDRNIIRILPGEGQDMWILSPHSLHKVTYPSPLQVLDLENVSCGRILASIALENSILLGTSHGVFVVHKGDAFSDGWVIKKIPAGLPESIHLLVSCGNRLFAAGSQHLYSIADGKAEQMDAGSFSGLIAPARDTLVASSQAGNMVYILKESPSGPGSYWLMEHMDPSFASSHSFVKFEGQVYFLNANGIYRLTRDYREAVPLVFTSGELLSRFIKVDGELCLLGTTRVFRFDRQEETFLPVPQGALTEILIRSDDLLEENGRYWIKQAEGKYRSSVFSTTSLESRPSEYEIYPVLGQLGEILDLHIRDSVLYLTGKDRLSVYDLRQLALQKESGSVRIEWLKSEETGLLNFDLPSVYEKFPGEGSLVLPHSSNDVVLSLAGLEFQSVPEPLFRYSVSGGAADWGDWQTLREIRLKNLGRGKHFFRAESMDLNGRIYGPAGTHTDHSTPRIRSLVCNSHLCTRTSDRTFSFPEMAVVELPARRNQDLRANENTTGKSDPGKGKIGPAGGRTDAGKNGSRS
jgi:hypothetical protein